MGTSKETGVGGSQGSELSAPARVSSVSHQLRTHARRSGVALLNALLNRIVIFRAVGALNKRLRLIKSVFLVYPATPDYALAYAYPSRIEKAKWSPWPTGILWQDGRLALMLAVSSTDQDFLADDARPRLVELERAVDRVRRLVAAEQKSFAGVLPGIMARHGVLTDPPERELTAGLVRQAVQELHPPERGPVIVIGGRGFIGRRLVELLEPAYETHVVDVDDRWPDHVDERALVVNVANRGAIQAHEKDLLPGMTILNEVYPEPRGALLDRLSARGIAVHHVVGVRAGAFPPFPSGYRGAVPCCAAWPSSRAKVVVRQLNEVSPRQGQPADADQTEPEETVA